MDGTQALQATTPLTITLFGPFAIRLEGQPLPRLRSHKEQWLLALLILRANRPVERDWLAGTLWPESTQSQAANNLRRSLWILRQALGTQAARLLSPSLHTVQLDLASAMVDVFAFDRAVAQTDFAALETAVKLYGGPLLEGCTEEWVFAERQSREQAYLSALEKLTAQAMANGDLETAVTYLRQVVLADPLRESAQRSLMQALADQGNPAAAILAYRDYRLLLRRELNTDPAPETMALFQQIRQDARRLALPASSPALAPVATPQARTISLPTPVTRLIGREQELVEIGACLLASRLVTLTGTGGVGKTRLAIEVARQVAEDYAQGVWFVELAPIVESALVIPTVASTLSVQEAAGHALLQTLIDHLGAKQALLVLDNCEHLIDACAQLVDTLLRNCPHLRILATSRQSLGLTGEVAFRIPSLTVPPDLSRKAGGEKRLHGESAEKDQMPVILEYEAARLFVERAHQARPAFRLSARHAEPISRICRQLDGIPLAIELAAARLQVLSIEEIDARLEDRFRLLTGGSRTALPRQQTLQAALDWSYDLLSPEERQLLQRLSVFVGGWTLEATEAVCSGEEIEARQMLDLLASLVDKSLVIAEEWEDKTRYRLLESVRQYSRERLQASREERHWRDRHLQFYLSLAEEAEPELTGVAQTEWLERLESEHDNLRAALIWSRQEKKCAEAGLRLAGACWRFWNIRGYWSEGREHLQAILSQEAAGPQTPARARALNAVGHMAFDQGDYTAARAFYEESLAIFRKLGDKQGIALSLGNLGNVAYSQGAYATARALFEQGLPELRESGNKWGVAGSLNSLGNVAKDQGEYTRASSLYRESLALRRELGDRHGLAYTLLNLGNVAYLQGDYAAARTPFEECLAEFRELGDKWGVAGSLNSLGLIALYQGDYATACALLEECLAVFRELGDRRGVAASLNSLGLVAYRQGDNAVAWNVLGESLAINRELGDKWGIAESLQALAALAAGWGQKERAARLWAAAEALREAIGAPLPPKDKEQIDREVAAVRAAIGEPAFSAGWTEGRAMTIDQAVEYALE